MTALRTRTTVSGIEAAPVLEALLAHLAEQEMVATIHEDGWRLDYESAQIVFSAHADTLRVDINAPTPESLFDARMMVQYHIANTAGCEMGAIEWAGDKPTFERPPAFRILTVTNVMDLTAHMRRVRFKGTNLSRYDRAEDLHCKLLLPQPGTIEPEWPVLGPDGMPQYPEGEKRLDMRTYTIRRIDVIAGWMEVDFVLHDDAGPGTAWATLAQPGHQVGILGPGGRTARPSSWMLLAGDETALPAIARIAEKLPSDTRGEIIIEVGGAADELPLTAPSGMNLRWLHQGAQPAGTTTQLQEAIFACAIPSDTDRFAWVAAEFSTAQAVRPWLRDTVGMSGKEQLVVAYWRLGMDESRMKSGGAREAKRNQGDAAKQ